MDDGLDGGRNGVATLDGMWWWAIVAMVFLQVFVDLKRRRDKRHVRGKCVSLSVGFSGKSDIEKNMSVFWYSLAPTPLHLLPSP